MPTDRRSTTTPQGPAPADREGLLFMQVERLAHHIQAIEHDYSDLLSGPQADLNTALHCCRKVLDRAIEARHRRGSGRSL
ncbi:MAG: hypothetical protein KF745_12820 [Phycisphaeraceae bacterium]|nr:hypothetical protein [Phycisphaeraceae bacterium]